MDDAPVLLKLRNGVHLFPVPKTERLPTKALLAGIFLHGGRRRVTIKKLVVVFGVSLLLVMIVLPVSVSVNYSAS